jgi:hypothetical protein
MKDRSSHRRRRLRHDELRHLPLAIRMRTSKLRLESTQLRRVVNSSPNEMLHACLPRQLVDPNAPIDLSFLPTANPLHVGECGIGAGKHPPYVCVVGALEWDDGDMWKGGEGCGVGGVDNTYEDSGGVAAGGC